MARILAAIVLTLAASVCFAESALLDDINHCRWRDGRKISKSQCEDLQDKLGDVADRIAEFRETLAKPDAQDWQRKSAKEGWGELVQYAKDLMDRSFKLSKMKADPNKSCDVMTKVAGQLMYLPCDPDAPKKPWETEEEKEEAALKRQCGKDYMALRVGMKIKRLEQCLGAIYETETVTQKGTIETYRTTHNWVYVQNGVVTGFTDRTD